MRLRLPCACVLAIAMAACGQAPAPATQAPAGDAVQARPATATPQATATADYPTLSVTTLEGARYELAERRGRWVVVNFWATWCAPCIKEMPELSRLDAENEHVEVIGLAYETIEPAALQAFLEKRPVVYPVAIVDMFSPPADFATPRGLPMTYVIAPDGRVAEQFLGPVTAAEIEAVIARAQSSS
jgi:thiol-disulfide isomerase/thioredoxin